jgi:hypothetical protein
LRIEDDNDRTVSDNLRGRLAIPAAATRDKDDRETNQRSADHCGCINRTRQCVVNRMSKHPEAGDCDGNSQTAIFELLRGVNILLGSEPPRRVPGVRRGWQWRCEGQ